ncbi:hypothetical protein PR003_g4073 [Phytophthora rubi]|uniref:Ubiquitin-like protease family profile domain-containing protein n=1 Tax=Phytophthora rubi TaxID=129364 RepID=A0A6A4G2N5_9STRA|nr:hypothetical protein PR003_g4073 [Phytophthora rubi]
MKKRACVQRTLRQRIELLKKWRDNPDWTIVDAVRELGVKESTLRDWKRRYWHRLDEIVCDDFMRAKGAGPKRKIKSYEGRVLATEFAILKSQKTWVRHFIDHYGGGKNKDSEASTTGVGQNNAATTVDHNKAATSVGQNNEVEVPRSGVGDGDDDGVGEQVSEEYPVKEGNAPAEVSSDSCDNGSSSSDECDNSADSDFEVEVSVPKSAPSSKSTILRKRVSKDGVRLKWPNGVDHIWIVAEDVDSLKPYQFLSATAIDYFINRNMVRVPGSVYTCGSKFYRTIEAARAAQDPGAKAERLKTLSEMLEWSGYSYLLLPIWANKHWSFITVENAFRDGPTGLFHVNSLKGVHNSLRVFDTVKWFLFQEQRRLAGDTLCEWRYGTFNTQPQQSNAVDCGIYLLHYMDIMARKIVELQPQLCTRPRTMKDKVAEWSVGKFNTHQAEERLGSLLDVLLRDIKSVDLLSASA